MDRYTVMVSQFYYYLGEEKSEVSQVFSVPVNHKEGRKTYNDSEMKRMLDDYTDRFSFQDKHRRINVELFLAKDDGTIVMLKRNEKANPLYETKVKL